MTLVGVQHGHMPHSDLSYLVQVNDLSFVVTGKQKSRQNYSIVQGYNFYTMLKHQLFLSDVKEMKYDI